MAGLTWFERDVDLHENPKVRALMVRLREPLADAYVDRIYAYCYRQARDQFDPVVAVETIEKAAEWHGRRGTLFDALHSTGILERDAGMVVVHGVAERLAPHLAKRQADAERQRRRRDRAAASIGRHAPVTRDVTGYVTRESRSNRDIDSNREEKIPPLTQARARDQGTPGEAPAEPVPPTGRLSPLPRRGERLAAENPATARLLALLEAGGWLAGYAADAVGRSALERAVLAQGEAVVAERLLAHVRVERAAGREPRPTLGWHQHLILGEEKRGGDVRVGVAAPASAAEHGKGGDREISM